MAGIFLFSEGSTRMKNALQKMVLAAMFLALSLVLPFLTGQIPQFGQMLTPMHIPVLLCGFVCGWPYGLVTGFIAPLLRFALFGMPPLFPTGVSMAFELAVYGLVAGILYRLLPPKTLFTYVTLISAMLAGRAVWGISRLIITGVNQTAFTFAVFFTEAFVKSIPGIIVQIILVPLIILALKRARLMPGND
jgi:thiamine transporter ThiT